MRPSRPTDDPKLLQSGGNLDMAAGRHRYYAIVDPAVADCSRGSRSFCPIGRPPEPPVRHDRRRAWNRRKRMKAEIDGPDGWFLPDSRRADTAAERRPVAHKQTWAGCSGLLVALLRLCEPWNPKIGRRESPHYGIADRAIAALPSSWASYSAKLESVSSRPYSSYISRHAGLTCRPRPTGQWHGAGRTKISGH